MAHHEYLSFIGTGNVAWHLAPALDNLGFVVKEVYGRNPRQAEALTDRLYQAEVKATLDFSTSPSRIFVLATTDEAIPTIAKELVLPDDALLLHTSGSQPLEVLKYSAAAHQGVLYPLQTFTKGKRIDFKEVPLFIEAWDEHAEKILMRMARALSNKVMRVGSAERKALHVAAVFASNFTNHMLSISEHVLKKHHLDFQVMRPLIEETVSKALSIGPRAAQTGPAKRGDLQILDEHLAFLGETEDIAEVYKVVSQHILDWH